MRIDLLSVRVVDENDNAPFDSDEPYVLVQVVALSNIFDDIPDLTALGINVPALNLPTVRTLRFGPWSGVDEGETVKTIEWPAKVPLTQEQEDALRRFLVFRDPIWGPQGSWPIGDPDQLFIHVQMMEWDGSSVSRVNTAIQAPVAAELLSAINSGENHAQLSRRMKDAFATNIDIGTFSVTNSDDRIGDPQELVITREMIKQVEEDGTILFRQFTFRNASSEYRLQFRLKR